ncbi:CPBP family intramembrane glutamic endopeptidase [Trinickia terrae]|nr:CPBP family intramembrane glutamic endopeptidase [Trinickia terrae]
MLYNGASGLIYYSSMAARVFVSNAGLITTIAIGGYFFPEETVAGVVGAVAIRGANWITKKVDPEHRVHIATGIDRLLSHMPNYVSVNYIRASRVIARPQGYVSTGIANTPQLSWVNESLATELLSPFLEESIFRVGVQEGLALGLMAVGVPRPAASFLSGSISASLFAGAHNANPDSDQYRDTIIAGIGFGVMMYLHGLPAAVVAHSTYNAGDRLEEFFRH